MILNRKQISFLIFTLLTCLVVHAETTTPNVSFLDEKAAQREIIDDSLTPYFNELQPMEMSAKTGSAIQGATLEQQRAECLKRYQAGVRSFTQKEKEAINWYVAKLYSVLNKEYPFFGQMNWSLLKITDQIEGGLPHTRGKHIILSETVCTQIMTIRQLPPAQLDYLGILDLLLHEQTHVFQRTYPGSFDSLYSNIWGFQKAKAITGCQWLTKHHLANPDAVDCSWILPVGKDRATRYLWPLVVFSEGDGIKRMPKDFRMLAISLEKTGETFQVQVDKEQKPVSSNLLLTPEFHAIFPMSTNIYHPDEASADMFAKLVMIDHFMPKEMLVQIQDEKAKECLVPLRKWFYENLAIKSAAPFSAQ